MNNIPRESINLQNNAAKMQDGLNINLPPNYQLYAKSERGINEEVKVNSYPRIGENNPLTIPARKSKIVNFDTAVMKRLDLEELINPQAKNVDLMNRELQMYREQVRQQNEEVQKLEELKNRLADNSLNITTNDRQQQLMQLKAQKEALLRQVHSNPQSTQLVQQGNYFDSNHNVNNEHVSDQIIQPTGNFFDVQEDVYIDNINSSGQTQPQQYHHSMNNQNKQVMHNLEEEGYYFY